MPDRKDYLKNTIQHIDITKHNVVPLVESMQHMAFSSRDLARAADIYDRTLNDEEELRHCDETTQKIADELDPRPYSSREFIREMGAYLQKNGKTQESIVLEAYKQVIHIF